MEIKETEDSVWLKTRRYNYFHALSRDVIYHHRSKEDQKSISYRIHDQGNNENTAITQNINTDVYSNKFHV